MLKILQARLQQLTELTDVQAGFRKGGNQIANIFWIIKKAREFQINICFVDFTKSFNCVDQKPWNIPNEMGILDHLHSEKSVCRSRSNN